MDDGKSSTTRETSEHLRMTSDLSSDRSSSTLKPDASTAERMWLNMLFLLSITFLCTAQTGKGRIISIAVGMTHGS